MDLIKKFFVLIAIFCVIGSASAVCATNVSDDFAALGESQYQDEDGWAGSQYNETGNNVDNAVDTANTTVNVTNDTANESVPEIAENAGNTTVPHAMFATGHPILALLGVSALLGGYTILRKKD